MLRTKSVGGTPHAIIMQIGYAVCLAVIKMECCLLFYAAKLDVSCQTKTIKRVENT